VKLIFLLVFFVVIIVIVVTIIVVSVVVVVVVIKLFSHIIQVRNFLVGRTTKSLK